MRCLPSTSRRAGPKTPNPGMNAGASVPLLQKPAERAPWIRTKEPALAGFAGRTPPCPGIHAGGGWDFGLAPRAKTSALLLALAVLAFPACARAQACCAGGNVVTPGRLDPHELALVGLQAHAATVFGSYDTSG